MKKTDIDKLQGLKLSGAMKQAATQGRFSGNATAAPNRREQRKLDQAQGLVPFAVKLDFDLVKQGHALAQERNIGLNDVVAELLKKAWPAERTAHVRIYSYGGRSAGLWWDQVRDKLDRTRNLTVINVPAASSQAMAGLAERNMRLQCTIQDGRVWLTDGQATAEVEPVTIKASTDSWR